MSIPASKASAKAGSLATMASSIAVRLRTTWVMPPPKCSGRFSPIASGASGFSSIRMTVWPRRAASIAAARPAGPAPMTSTPVRSCSASVVPAIDFGSANQATGPVLL
jgi:hypothetical protein